MKTKWTVYAGITLFACLSGGAVARAENARIFIKESHGGHAYVCRDGREHATQLLDLAEARLSASWQPVETVGSGDSGDALSAAFEDAFRIVSRLAVDSSDRHYAWRRALLEEARAELKWLSANLTVLSKAHEMYPPSRDYGKTPLRDPMCGIEQVAFYAEDGSVVFSAELFQALPHADQVALLVHEAVYKLDRLYFGSVTSEPARRLTATLMSRQSDTLVKKTLFKHFETAPLIDYTHLPRPPAPPVFDEVMRQSATYRPGFALDLRFRFYVDFNAQCTAVFEDQSRGYRTTAEFLGTEAISYFRLIPASQLQGAFKLATTYECRSEKPLQASTRSVGTVTYLQGGSRLVEHLPLLVARDSVRARDGAYLTTLVTSGWYSTLNLSPLKK